MLKKICSVLSVNVLMDVTIPKMMFQNKLLKLPSKIPSLNLLFISTSAATGWFLKSSPLIGCRKTSQNVCTWQSLLSNRDFIIDFFNNEATTNFETISIPTVLQALKNRDIHLV
jgi:hypothetical protein